MRFAPAWPPDTGPQLAAGAPDAPSAQGAPGSADLPDDPDPDGRLAGAVRGVLAAHRGSRAAIARLLPGADTDVVPPAVGLSIVDEVVSALEAFEVLQNTIAAARFHALSAAHDAAVRRVEHGTGDFPHRSLRAEIATALHQSEQRVDQEISLASALTAQFSATLAVLLRGEISAAHARAIVECASPLGHATDARAAQLRARYESETLARARTHTPHGLRPIARRIAQQLAATLPPPDAPDPSNTPDGEGSPDAPTLPEVKLGDDRRVRVCDLDNGMSELIAFMPTIEAHAITDRLAQLAKSAAVTEPQPAASRPAGEPGVRDARSGLPRRSSDQIRSDVLRDLLLAGTPTRLIAGSPEEAVRARVQVIVTASDPADSPSVTTRPAATRAAPAEARFEVAELVGAGVLPPEAVRGYARHTDTWERVTVSPESGAVLRVDTYRPSAAMRRYLGARDLHCRFPGCRVPVHRCDIDHTVPAAVGGDTATNNLAHLCRAHHTMKHNSDWEMRQLADGTISWRAPTGRLHTTEPPSRTRFVRSDTPTPAHRLAVEHPDGIPF